MATACRARSGARPPTWRPSSSARASDDIDERTDVFGLGGILFEILTGKPPERLERLLGPALAEPGAARDERAVAAASARSSAASRQGARAAQRASLPERRAAYAPTWNNFSGRRLVRDARISSRREHRHGGRTRRRAYIIERGHCEVFKNGGRQARFIRRLGPGDVFGETAVLTRAPRTASVVAATDVTLKVITGDSLNRELDRNPGSPLSCAPSRSSSAKPTNASPIRAHPARDSESSASDASSSV